MRWGLRGSFLGKLTGVSAQKHSTRLLASDTHNCPLLRCLERALRQHGRLVQGQLLPSRFLTDYMA